MSTLLCLEPFAHLDIPGYEQYGEWDSAGITVDTTGRLYMHGVLASENGTKPAGMLPLACT